ncbi:MAG: FtsX-like permease family protein [Clostridium sp.]
MHKTHIVISLKLFLLIYNKEIKETSSDKTIFRNYYINSDNIEEVKKEFKGVDISYMTMIDKSMLNTTFILEMLPSIILILVSLCLIIIACLILRFTIVFTIQDDFKEIGIMKAIGLRSCAIKKIFLIKYFIISLIGVVIGGGISIPIGEALLKKSAAGMLMEPSENGWILNLVSGIGIILIPLLSLI